MFHLSANFGAIANVTLTQINAVPDGIYQISSAGNWIYPQALDLIQVYAGAVTLTRAQLNSPKARQITPINWQPINGTLTPATLPNVVDLTDRPFRITAQEEQQVLVTDSAAGPNNCYYLSWVQQMYEPCPRGDIYTLHASATTASVASTWTLVQPVFDTQLPAGRYSVVGGTYVAATAVAFSLTFDNQYQRPGGLGQVNFTDQPWWRQLKGGLGKWGDFDTVTLPRISVLNDGVVNVHDFFLDIIRIG